jgi:hypothetical protein
MMFLRPSSHLSRPLSVDPVQRQSFANFRNIDSALQDADELELCEIPRENIDRRHSNTNLPGFGVQRDSSLQSRTDKDEQSCERSNASSSR